MKTLFCAVGLVLAASTSIASAHTVAAIIGPAGGFQQVHPESDKKYQIPTKSDHTAGTPYQHIVNDSETGTIWGPWTRTTTATFTVMSCIWSDTYIVRTLHDNQGTGNAYYTSSNLTYCY